MKQRILSAARDRRGLSLLEVLLAMAIFSAVIIASYSILFAGLKVYSGNSSSIEEQRSLRMVFMRIDRDVRSYGGDIGGITAGAGTLTIGTVAYSFDLSAGTVSRTEDGETAAVAGSISGFTAAVQNDGILIELTGMNDAARIQSKIKLRSEIDGTV